MTLTPSFITRAIDVSGRAIATLINAASEHIQLVALADVNGNQMADSVGLALPVTDIDHHLTHLGRTYIHADIHVIPAAGGANTLDLILWNPNTEEVHLSIIEVTSTQGDAQIGLYREVIANDDGVVHELYNKNFNGADASRLSIKSDPTGLNITGADEVEHFLLVGGKSQGGLAESGVDEYVMKQDQKLLLRYTNNANQDDIISVKIGTLEP